MGQDGHHPSRPKYKVTKSVIDLLTLPSNGMLRWRSWSGLMSEMRSVMRLHLVMLSIPAASGRELDHVFCAYD